MKRPSLIKALILAGAIAAALLTLLLPGDTVVGKQHQLLNTARSLMFNTGELSAAHGRQRMACTGCHSWGQPIANDNCYSCHDNSWFLENNRMLAQSHRLFNLTDNCLRCHNEHIGKFTPLTEPLGKKHEALPNYLVDMCEVCHRSQGNDSHQNMINQQCNYCHTVSTWSPSFDHWETEMLSTNNDSFTDCDRCHPPNYHQSQINSGEFKCGQCHIKGRKLF